jgi:hypothetical protein
MNKVQWQAYPVPTEPGFYWANWQQANRKNARGKY